MPKLCLFIIAMAIISACIPGYAQESIRLPDPSIHDDLMKALEDRSTYRSYSPEPLSRQLLADILWAAYGINNRETGRRTVATAFNMREMSIYALVPGGAFLYNAPDHSLVHITGEDIRGLVTTQEYTINVPLHLVYVADYDLVRKQSPEWSHDFSGQYPIMHTGQISQNVYLYCALNGLGTVVRDVVNEEELGEKLGLHPSQKIITSQAVGFPGP